MSPHASRQSLVDFEELRGRRRKRVGDHLARCPRCRARLARLRLLRRAAAEATAGRPSHDLWASIEARLDEGPAVILPLPDPVEARRRRQGARRVTLTAALALLVFAGLAAAAVVLTPLQSLVRRRGPAERAAPVHAPIPVGALEVEVPPGGFTVALPDAEDAFRLHVVLRDEALLALVPVEAGQGLAFRSGAARIDVGGARRGLLEVRAPTTGGAVRIVARGVVVAVVRAGLVRVPGREAVPELIASVGELLRAAGGPSR